MSSPLVQAAPQLPKKMAACPETNCVRCLRPAQISRTICSASRNSRSVNQPLHSRCSARINVRLADSNQRGAAGSTRVAPTSTSDRRIPTILVVEIKPLCVRSLRNPGQGRLPRTTGKKRSRGNRSVSRSRGRGGTSARRCSVSRLQMGATSRLHSWLVVATSKPSSSLDIRRTPSPKKDFRIPNGSIFPNHSQPHLAAKRCRRTEPGFEVSAQPAPDISSRLCRPPRNTNSVSRTANPASLNLRKFTFVSAISVSRCSWLRSRSAGQRFASTCSPWPGCLSPPSSSLASPSIIRGSCGPETWPNVQPRFIATG